MDAALRKDREIFLVMLCFTKSPSTLSTRHHSMLVGHYQWKSFATLSCSHSLSECQVNQLLVNCCLNEESKHICAQGASIFMSSILELVFARPICSCSWDSTSSTHRCLNSWLILSCCCSGLSTTSATARLTSSWWKCGTRNSRTQRSASVRSPLMRYSWRSASIACFNSSTGPC